MKETLYLLKGEWLERSSSRVQRVNFVVNFCSWKRFEPPEVQLLERLFGSISIRAFLKLYYSMSPSHIRTYNSCQNIFHGWDQAKLNHQRSWAFQWYRVTFQYRLMLKNMGNGTEGLNEYHSNLSGSVKQDWKILKFTIRLETLQKLIRDSDFAV